MPLRSNRHRSVLIVDDEIELAHMLAEFLSSLGYHTEVAHGGNEALTAHLAAPFDLIISDIDMPQGTGVELLAGLRQNCVRVPPVVLITGRVECMNKYINIGANAFLEKPFDLDHLARVVEWLSQSEPHLSKESMPLTTVKGWTGQPGT